jgi:hypothetical protein
VSSAVEFQSRAVLEQINNASINVHAIIHRQDAGVGYSLFEGDEDVKNNQK